MFIYFLIYKYLILFPKEADERYINFLYYDISLKKWIHFNGENLADSKSYQYYRDLLARGKYDTFTKMGKK